MNKYLSIITLNVNGLNAPIKRHRIAEWIRKHDPHICCLQETHLRTKDLHRLKIKGWKQIFQANGQGKRARVAILISDKINFKTRAIRIKRKDLHLRLLYPAKLSFRMEGKIKCFSDKVKLKKFIITKPLLYEMLKGVT